MERKVGARDAGARDEGARSAREAAELPAPDDVAAPPADAQRTPSGLAWKVLRTGAGEHPRPSDVVRLHYSAWTTDGKTFDSTRMRGAPAEVPLEHTIRGWIEGIPLMVPGEVRRFWIPGKLAYEGRKDWPQGMLVFDIELVGVERRAQGPDTPRDLENPPAQASKTPSGLASLVLAPGKGKERPGPHDTVTVQYSGWTRDGTLIDSTLKRGGPSTFRVDKVIAGLTEGLRLMVVGEKRRLWIPAALAYVGREGPRGALVYDLELLDVRKGADIPASKGAASVDAGLQSVQPRALP